MRAPTGARVSLLTQKFNQPAVQTTTPLSVNSAQAKKTKIASTSKMNAPKEASDLRMATPNVTPPSAEATSKKVPPPLKVNSSSAKEAQTGDGKTKGTKENNTGLKDVFTVTLDQRGMFRKFESIVNNDNDPNDPDYDPEWA